MVSLLSLPLFYIINNVKKRGVEGKRGGKKQSREIILYKKFMAKMGVTVVTRVFARVSDGDTVVT